MISRASTEQAAVAARRRRGAVPPTLALAAAACLAACSTTSTTPAPPSAQAHARPTGPDAEFAWSAAPGSNTLSGVIAYQPQKGERWGCSLQAIALMPDAPTSRARMMALYGSATFAVKPVAEVREKAGAVGGVTFSAFVKQTACDQNDRFAFDQLADGPYFILARSKKLRPKPASGDEGVAIIQRVVLTGGHGTTIKVPAF